MPSSAATFGLLLAGLGLALGVAGLIQKQKAEEEKPPGNGNGGTLGDLQVVGQPNLNLSVVR